MPVPLIDKDLLLQKMGGKGGWTYALLPEVEPGQSTPFRWRKVKGTIDGVPLRQYHLMPFGNGKLFLPVKAAIRKQIKKGAGDYVHVCLFADNEKTPVPEDLLLCLQDEPGAMRYFQSLGDDEKAAYSRWIDSAGSIALKTKRLAVAVDRLARGLFLEKKQHPK